MHKKLSLKEVAWEVEKDGLDYAIREYCFSNDIKDKELSSLWFVARIILARIENILVPYMGGKKHESKNR